MNRYWTVPRHWAGETVAILGCGPSLSLVDFDALRDSGQRVIAINDAIFEFADADILYFCDRKWWDGEFGRRERVEKLGIPFWRVTLENEIPGVFRMRNTGATGFDEDPQCLRHGSNSGYQAMHLAVHLGAARIILHGFDMRIVRGELHAMARRERQDEAGFGRVLREEMLPKFQTLVDPLRERGVEVINATPGSALTCWPAYCQAWQGVTSNPFFEPQA